MNHLLLGLQSDGFPSPPPPREPVLASNAARGPRSTRTAPQVLGPTLGLYFAEVDEVDPSQTYLRYNSMTMYPLYSASPLHHCIHSASAHGSPWPESTARRANPPGEQRGWRDTVEGHGADTKKREYNDMTPFW